jgi:hypothetical protein
MSEQTQLSVPESDAWLISGIAGVLINRIVHSESEAQRRSLIRLVCAIQRLPAVVRGTNLGVSMGSEIDSMALSICQESLRISRFEEGSTVLELLYMPTGQRCAALGYGDLHGEVRTNAMRLWLDSLRHYVLESGVPLYVEDLSDGAEVDRVPIWFSKES